MSRSLTVIITAALVLLLGRSVVLAIGGGGGGSVPSCASDTWSCSAWGTCSTTGQQKRTCVLTYDCPTALTRKPAETQVCTYTTPTNTNTTTTNSGPSIANANLSIPACTQDAWSCGAWSTTCNTEGQEHRTCTLASDCNSVSTPPPASARLCTHLQCGQKTDMRERILCRLNLTPAGIAQELSIEYLPEECRAMTNAGELAKCVRYYQSYQSCWALPAGPGRFNCARTVLKLGPVISTEVKACQGKTGQDQVQCQADIRDKVFDFVKFRLYDLETRAEELGNRGVDLQTIADLETTIEFQKQAFDLATTVGARRQAILNVRLAWEQFVAAARQQIHT